MDPLTLALIMGGGGIIKGATVDRAKENRDIQLAAATQRFSPWTGLKANPITRADPLGQGLQYGATGAALGQSAQSAQNQGDLMQAQSEWLRSYGPQMAREQGVVPGVGMSQGVPHPLTGDAADLPFGAPPPPNDDYRTPTAKKNLYDPVIPYAPYQGLKLESYNRWLNNKAGYTV